MAGNDNWASEINGAQDDDEALRIAIALSLGHDPGVGGTDQQRPHGGDMLGVIDLTKDDDGDVSNGADDGIGAVGDDGGSDGVVPAGEGKQAPGQRVTTTTAAAAAAAKSEIQPPSVSGFAALGLDRRKMEEERLVRVGKRKAEQALVGGDDAVSSSQPARRLRIAAGQGSVLSSRPFPAGVAGGERGKELEQSGAAGSTLFSASSSPARPPFPRGIVKKTWAFGQPRLGDDIKIEEVFQKHQLELAVLSSYQWDEEWLLSKIDLARTKLILIAFAADEKQKEEMRSNVPRERIRFCFPPMQAMGTMHSKLQLLKYEKYLRIAIPTGNLMSFDWGETGTMENMVFIIDLPKFQTAEERNAQELTPFAEELFYFLRAQGLDEKLVSSLGNYNFAETRRYALVHTIPGSHAAEDAWKRTGYCGLGRAVSTLGLGTSRAIEVDFVCASLGAVNYSLLTALYRACQGDSGLKEYESRAAGSGRTKAASSTGDGVALVQAHMRVFFPSLETVLQSKGGRDGAGTICFQAKWWGAPSFPREVLRDCVSVRPGLLMHNKVIYVRPRETSLVDSAACEFAYVGSANLSESAWGRLARDRATGRPKLTCRNWECGVLVQASHVSPACEVDAGFRAFCGEVPVPMHSPGRSFPSESAETGATPWFYQAA